jgi:hypothetical protein
VRDGARNRGVSGRALDDAAFGAATQVTSKFVSPADSAARWTGDVDNGIIVDVEATTATRQAEILAAKRMRAGGVTTIAFALNEQSDSLYCPTFSTKSTQSRPR